MPPYDDRRGNTRLYVGHLSSRTRSRDLESLFSRYGRVRGVDMKHEFAFVDFSDPRDAEDAKYGLNGRDIDGSRIIVEFAKGGRRGSSGGSREYMGRAPSPGSGRCFNCGIDGHWARDCKAGDWKNKCYRCGERGHIERNCQNSPKKLSRRGRSYSRSPVRSRSPRRGRGRSRSLSLSRSYSRSRSPPRRERISEREEKRSKNPRRSSISPEPKKRSPPPSKASKRSLTPEEGSPVERASPSPSPKRAKHVTDRDGSDYGESPRAKSRSPVSAERDSPRAESRSPVSAEMDSPDLRRSRSPSEANGRSHSPPPKNDRSPVDDDDDDDDDGDNENRHYRRRSASE